MEALYLPLPPAHPPFTPPPPPPPPSPFTWLEGEGKCKSCWRGSGCRYHHLHHHHYNCYYFYYFCCYISPLSLLHLQLPQIQTESTTFVPHHFFCRAKLQFFVIIKNLYTIPTTIHMILKSNVSSNVCCGLLRKRTF